MNNYFKNKFEAEKIENAIYENFDIADITLFKTRLKQENTIKGFNVTIPYKESIIPYLDKLNKKAKAIGADHLSDIAVLQLEAKEKFIPVSFGDSDKARIGDWVIAIGNPFGLGGTVTSGIISARNRSIGLSRYEDYIKTDASINSGNLGGRLFDMDGHVI